MVEDIWEVGIQWAFYMNLVTIPQGGGTAAGEWELGRKSRRGIAGLYPRSSPSSCMTNFTISLTNLAALQQMLRKQTNTDTSTSSTAYEFAHSPDL